MTTNTQIWDKHLQDGKAGIKESVMDMLEEARADERQRIYAARIKPPWEGKAVVESLTHGEIVQIPTKELRPSKEVRPD